MVAKHPARSPEKRPDPVVYLAGVNELIAADFIRDRDILVVSQRGTTKTVLVFVGRSKSRASWRAYSGGISLKA